MQCLKDRLIEQEATEEREQKTFSVVLHYLSLPQSCVCAGKNAAGFAEKDFEGTVDHEPQNFSVERWPSQTFPLVLHPPLPRLLPHAPEHPTSAPPPPVRSDACCPPIPTPASAPRTVCYPRTASSFTQLTKYVGKVRGIWRETTCFLGKKSQILGLEGVIADMHWHLCRHLDLWSKLDQTLHQCHHRKHFRLSINPWCSSSMFFPNTHLTSIHSPVDLLLWNLV